MKETEAFRSLDEHAQAVLEAIEGNTSSTHELLQSERVRTEECYHRTVSTIITKQNETQLEITVALEALEESSRAEQEITRQELEQMKQAMLKIEQDMIHRDSELKGLLLALGQARNEREKEKLQEKSNAVTAAIYALVVVYQSLQVQMLSLATEEALTPVDNDSGPSSPRKYLARLEKPQKSLAFEFDSSERTHFDRIYARCRHQHTRGFSFPTRPKNIRLHK